MGFMDKLKGLLRKNKKQVNEGIDKVADIVEDKVPDEHADKVDDVADKAKEVLDKLDGPDEAPKA